MDVRSILVVVCEELMSMACCRIHVGVKVPASHEPKIKVNNRKKNIREGLGAIQVLKSGGDSSSGLGRLPRRRSCNTCLKA